MKLVSSLGVFMLSGLVMTSGWAAPQRTGDFALIDDSGKLHQLSRYRHKKALVLLSQDASCATSAADVAALKSLEKSWQEKEVAFALLDSTVGAKAPATFLGLPTLLDETQLVAETLELTAAGQAVVLDPERMQLVYRGPVGPELAKALGTVTAGAAEETVNLATKGCSISFPSSEQHAKGVPDYASAVAPIIKENCASCHRAGGIGPFALDSYMMVKGWSPMIREVLLTKRMPPAQVDPAIGHFTNARYLASNDMQTLVHWIDAGSPKGGMKDDPLVGLEWPDLRSWQLGEPDYIVTAPAHDVPATGVIDYVNIDVDLPFTEDKWVKAVQFIPGDTAVLHHLLTYVTGPNEDFDGGEGGNASIARRFLEGFAPGKTDAMVFPEDTGVFIPKGHKISLQFHYTTNGKATTDATIFGLYFHDKPPKYEYLNRSVSGRFKIPPYAVEHPTEGSYVFKEEVMVYGLRAHMHFRGKNMRFLAEFPDGTKRDLLNVANYNYAWQPTYELSQPVLLPEGTKVHVTGAFDNSQYNPGNPDPSKEIGFGLQSWDEMFIGYWSYHPTKPANP